MFPTRSRPQPRCHCSLARRVSAESVNVSGLGDSVAEIFLRLRYASGLSLAYFLRG
jgi:hypothetical protein